MTWAAPIVSLLLLAYAAALILALRLLTGFTLKASRTIDKLDAAVRVMNQVVNDDLIPGMNGLVLRLDGAREAQQSATAVNGAWSAYLDEKVNRIGLLVNDLDGRIRELGELTCHSVELLTQLLELRERRVPWECPCGAFGILSVPAGGLAGPFRFSCPKCSAEVVVPSTGPEDGEGPDDTRPEDEPPAPTPAGGEAPGRPGSPAPVLTLARW